MMDGDRIGKLLSGSLLLPLKNFVHPILKEEIEEKYPCYRNLLEKPRLLTPSHHIAISRAMNVFSLQIVPKIVEKYDGRLVYAGGDDILALFLAKDAIKAAWELQDMFKKGFINGAMLLGKNVSMSAGIVFAHYKWPLFDVLEKARDAEKKAKSKYGRNALCLVLVKRSGEVVAAGIKWDFVHDLMNIVENILDGKISRKFIYDFMEVVELLESNEEMLKAEVERLLRRRVENATKEEINAIEGKILCLIDKASSNGIEIKEVPKAIKIIYDALRGEER